MPTNSSAPLQCYMDQERMSAGSATKLRVTDRGQAIAKARGEGIGGR